MGAALVTGCSKQPTTTDGNESIAGNSAPSGPPIRSASLDDYRRDLKCVANFAYVRAAFPANKEFETGYRTYIELLNADSEQLKIPDAKKTADFSAAMDVAQKELAPLASKPNFAENWNPNIANCTIEMPTQSSKN